MRVSSETCRAVRRNIIKLYIVASRWTVIDVCTYILFSRSAEMLNISQFRLNSCIVYDTITVFRHVCYVWILLRWHEYAPLETVMIMMGTRDVGVCLICELLYRILVISVLCPLLLQMT